MKTARYTRYGDASVLELVDAPTPTPGPGEVRVRVRAAGCNPKDVLVRKGKFKLFALGALPITPCYDFAGTIDAVGPRTTDFEPGHHVYGMLQGFRRGAASEFVVARVNECSYKPDSLSWHEAAAAPLAALTSLQALRDLGRVRPGMRVLVNGASGGVGTFAVQLARAMGAEVTGVCSHRNLELVRDLGAKDVIDYTQQDPLALEQRFDVVYDVFGSMPFPASRHLLPERGVHITTIPNADAVRRHLMTRLGRQRALLVVVRSRRRDLAELSMMIQTGELRVVVDRTYALDDIAEAHRYLETKRARGKVVIDVLG